MSQTQTFNGPVHQVAGRDINNYQAMSQLKTYDYGQLIGIHNQLVTDIRKAQQKQRYNIPRLVGMGFSIIGLLAMVFIVLNFNQVMATEAAKLVFNWPLIPVIAAGGLILIVNKHAKIYKQEQSKITQLELFKKQVHQELIQREVLSNHAMMDAGT